MTIKITTSQILKIACYVSLFIFALPLVDYYCPWYVNMIPMAMVLVVALTTKIGRKNAIVIMLLCVVLSLLDWYFLHRRQDFAMHMVDQVIALVPIVIAGQLDRTIIDKRFYHNFLQFGLILMCVTSITTYIGLELHPFAARELASESSTEYSLLNIGGYDYIYSLVLVLPIVCWMISQTKKGWKAINIVCLISYVLCVYQSQYTFAIIGMVIAAFLILAQRRPKFAIGLGVFLLVFVLLSGLQGLSNIFKWASETISMPYAADRLLQASQFLAGDKISTETTDERVVLMVRVVESITTKPLFGYNWDLFCKDQLSGHSYLLDWIAGAGLVGGAGIGFIYSRLFHLGHARKHTKVPNAVVLVWILFGLIAIVNPVVFYLNFTVLFIFTLCVKNLQQIEK